jgi:hypothetical protein
MAATARVSTRGLRVRLEIAWEWDQLDLDTNGLLRLGSSTGVGWLKTRERLTGWLGL